METFSQRTTRIFPMRRANNGGTDLQHGYVRKVPLSAAFEAPLGLIRQLQVLGYLGTARQVSSVLNNTILCSYVAVQEINI